MFKAVYQAAGLKPFRQPGLVRMTTAENGSPLHWACVMEERTLIRMLLKDGANINPADEKGYTPLHRAVQVHASEIITILLRANADPAVKAQGKGPAELAATLQLRAASTELAATPGCAGLVPAPMRYMGRIYFRSKASNPASTRLSNALAHRMSWRQLPVSLRHQSCRFHT
jgi:ankyrin repeat protein